MSIVSVIIPVHNTSGYIRKCVSSVLDQTLYDIEVILVENGSNDDSGIICDSIAEQDSRVKVIHLEVSDLSTARNRGVAAAGSEYIGFVDSDDYVVPEMYSTLYMSAVRYDADIVFCNFIKEYENGTRSAEGWSGREERLSPREAVYGIFEERISSSACTKLFRKRLLERYQFPEGRFFEDHDLVYRIVAECPFCIYVDKPLYIYTQRDDSTCHNVTPPRRYDYFTADYNRIGFVVDSPLFSREEKRQIIGHQLELCVCHFRTFLHTPGCGRFRKEMEDMRKKLISSGYKWYTSWQTRWHLFRFRWFWVFRAKDI